MRRPYLRMSTLVLALAASIAMKPQAGQVVRTVSGEEADREYRRNQELGDLYRRAAASRFVVVGKVIKLDLVADRAWKRPTIDESFAGYLYSIAIEKTVCRHADFSAPANVVGAPPPAEANPVVYLLSPVKPLVPGKESLRAGPTLPPFPGST